MTSVPDEPVEPSFWKLRLSSREWWILGAILFISLVLRMITLNHFRNVPDITTDGIFYRQVAQEFLNGTYFQEKKVFTFSPIYPFFVALVCRIAGADNIQAVRFVQNLLGLASCFILFLISFRLYGKKTAFITLLLSAFYVPFIFFETQALGISLVVFSMLLFLYCFTHLFLQDEDRLFEWKGLCMMVISGLSLGISVLGAPNTLVFFPAVVLWYLFFGRRKNWLKKGVVTLGSFFIGLVLALLPTTIINYQASGEFIPISTQGGINLYIGNNPNATGIFAPPAGFEDSMLGMNIKDVKRIAENATGKNMRYGEVSFYWMRKALDFIRSDPLRFIGLILKKTYYFINRYEIPMDVDPSFLEGYSFILRSPVITYGIISVFGLLGFVLCFRNIRKHGLLIILFAFFTISIVLFYINARYRLPAAPYLMVFSGISVLTLADWFFLKKWVPLGISAGGLVILAVLVFFPLGLYPSGITTYFNLGLYYNSKNDFVNAEKAFLKVLEEDPQWLQAEYLAARAQYELGNYDGSMARVMDLLKKNFMFSEGHMLRGKILARKGQYKEAWSEMSVSLFMNPDLLSERNILYNVLQSVQTKTEKAIRDTHEQLISQELRMNSLVESSFIAMRDKKFANAINDLNEFLVYAPQDINAQFNLAISYKEIGEYNNCLKVLSRINKANPDNKRVHKEMAMVYAYCTFDAEKAIYEIDRHLSIYPDDPDRALLEKARNELKRQ